MRTQTEAALAIMEKRIAFGRRVRDVMNQQAARRRTGDGG